MILNQFNIFDNVAIEKYFLGPEDVEFSNGLGALSLSYSEKFI